MRFCTVVNCMDGRIQLPVIEYLKERFGEDYVDNITAPGPVRLFADQKNPELKSILDKVHISVNAHKSKKIAVSAHPDCAGNPVPEAEQKRQLSLAVNFLRERYPECEIIGLWVTDNQKVSEVE